MPGRVSVYAVCHKFDKRALRSLLETSTALDARGVRAFPDDVIYWRREGTHDGAGGEFFVFTSTGMVALWSLLPEAKDKILLSALSQCAVEPLKPEEAHSDTLQFQISSTEQPSVRNDVITIASGSAENTLAVKLSISHALAQSTKLAHYEQRVMENVLRTAHIPHDLARTGHVNLGRNEIMRLIGTLFAQKAEVNVLSPLLDTPAYFWTAPDRLQTLYKSLCVYLELETRVSIVNSRLNVMEDLLQVLQNTQAARHSQKLEMIVIVVRSTCAHVVLHVL